MGYKFRRRFMFFFGFIFGELGSYREWHKESSRHELFRLLKKLGIKSA